MGQYDDGSLIAEDLLKPLAEFPWEEYRDFDPTSEQPSERTIEFLVGPRRIKISFDRDMIDLVQFLSLEDFPTIVVRAFFEFLTLKERMEMGPASGGGVFFFENEDYETKEVEESIKNCVASLRADFDRLMKK